MNHIIIYVPGLGDRDLTKRRRLLSLWHFRNVQIEICSMDWSVDVPWQTKLDKLIGRIDELAKAGHTVSLVGESAGAAAVLQALAARDSSLNRVILLCGKFQYPERVASWRYQQNPSFKDALTLSHTLLPKLAESQKSKLVNLHPIFDPVVPVAENKTAGFKNSLMPIAGHATSIVFANTIWSWRIVRLIKSS